jgi:hypothetical protein
MGRTLTKYKPVSNGVGNVDRQNVQKISRNIPGLERWPLSLFGVPKASQSTLFPPASVVTRVNVGKEVIAQRRCCFGMHARLITYRHH